MENKDLITTAFTYIDAQEAKMLKILQEFVELPSCSREPEVMPGATQWFVELLEKEGFKVELKDVGGNAPVVVADLGDPSQAAPVIFSGHYDTALTQEMSLQNPFRIEANKMYGTGILDMKGGIIIALLAAKAAQTAGYKGPIRLLFAGDEEINHVGANTVEVLMEQAKGAICAFNLETGLLSNKLAVFRKGGSRYTIRVTGVESHVSNFTKGRNAIIEAAHKAIEISKLTNLETGTTVNVGTINGGTIFNVVPGNCEFMIDIRFETNLEYEKTKQGLEAICNKLFVEETTTKLEFIDVMFTFETTPAGLELFEFMKETAELTGLEAIDQIRLGGSSDAAALTMADVPTICACGTKGEFNHTINEYAEVDSLAERAKLFSAAILRIDQFTPNK